MADRRALRIRPASRLRGVVSLPGDKSLSHRALLISSLGVGVSRVRNCAMAGVTLAMIEGLQTLGVQVTEENKPNRLPGAADLLITGKRPKGVYGAFQTTQLPRLGHHNEADGRCLSWPGIPIHS